MDYGPSTIMSLESLLMIISDAIPWRLSLACFLWFSSCTISYPLYSDDSCEPRSSIPVL